MKSVITASILVCLLLTGCANESSAPETATQEEMQSAPEADANTIVIRPVGDNMQYETTSFTVKAGATVTVVMENTAQSAAMQHNVVILAMGADVNTFGVEALQAGPDLGYVPAESDVVLAYTPLALPGETTEVTFAVPSEPGEYPFVCTFPGHYALMQGVMIVEA